MKATLGARAPIKEWGKAFEKSKPRPFSRPFFRPRGSDPDGKMMDSDPEHRPEEVPPELRDPSTSRNEANNVTKMYGVKIVISILVTNKMLDSLLK